MDKRAFLTKLKERGYINSREDAVAAMQKYRDNGGTFDDEQQNVSRETSRQSPKRQLKPIERTQYEKYGPAASFFPATTEATERGGNFISRAISGAGDALTLPARGVSALATGAGTIAGGGKISDAYRAAMSDMSRTKSTEKGVLGFAQNMALDPTSSPLIMAAAAPVKAAQGARAIPTLGKALLKAGGAGAADAAGSAAYQQAKEGKVSAGRTIGQAALGFGMGAGAAGLGTAVRAGAGKALKGAAIRNIDISLRPGQYGRKIGYNHENVVKHDLVGSPREVYEKSVQKLKSLQEQAVKIGKESRKKFDIGKMFDDVKSKISAQDNPEEFARQLDLIDSAKESYIKAFGQIVDAPTAMKIRSLIGEKSAFVGRTFGGQKVDPDASWKEAVYNKLYFKFKSSLHTKLKKSGELKAINRAQSEIIPVKQVAERRIPISESNQRIGLSDLLTTRVGQAAVGGALGAGTGYATSPEDRLKGTIGGLAVGAGVAAGRRALGSPTATKMYYRLGNKIAPKVQQTFGKVAGKSGKNIIRNNRGAVGGASDDFIGTPAIRDPETGRLYTGGWRGHKDAINKAENEAIRKRLENEFYKDRFGGAADVNDAPNVGFIDKHGDFISRYEAEKKAAIPRTPAQMFHTLGATAGLAGGGLTIGAVASRSRKKEKRK